MLQDVCAVERGLNASEGLPGSVVERELGIFLEQPSEVKDDAGIAFDEPAVEVGKAEELLNFFDLRRFRPGQDAVDLVLGYGNALMAVGEAEELGVGGPEFAFFGFGVQKVVNEALEDLTNVGGVIVGVVGEDQDVVEIDENLDVEEVSEDIVHEVLKCGRGVHEAEGHDETLEVSISSAEGSLPLVTLFDADEVVSTAKVELGEDFCVLQAVEGLGNEREGVSVLDGDFVEAAIVDAEAEGAVLFLDEEDRSGGWGL